jgi:hypothetical protein
MRIRLAIVAASLSTSVFADGLNISAIQVQDVGADDTDAFCAAFTLSEEQVREFFGKAQNIDRAVFNSTYDYLPCFVRGTAESAIGHLKWEIRAGGTGEVSDPAGKRTYFGCSDACDDLFGGS